MYTYIYIYLMYSRYPCLILTQRERLPHPLRMLQSPPLTHALPQTDPLSLLLTSASLSHTQVLKVDDRGGKSYRNLHSHSKQGRRRRSRGTSKQFPFHCPFSSSCGQSRCVEPETPKDTSTYTVLGQGGSASRGVRPTCCHTEGQQASTLDHTSATQK